MRDLPDLLVLQNLIRTVGSAVATIEADLWLVLMGIPEDCAKRAGIAAVAAADAQIGTEPHPAALARSKGIRRTDASTRRIGAGSADNDDESMPHASCRVHPDARARKSTLSRPTGARKHAGLATDTAIDVDDG
jgi:hypothetical protein